VFNAFVDKVTGVRNGSAPEAASKPDPTTLKPQDSNPFASE
jgi:hypothetical protein